MFSITSYWQLIAIILMMSKCSILDSKINYLTSNNNSISLPRLTFSKHFIVGISNNNVLYKSVLSNNDLFEMEAAYFLNPISLKQQSIQIMQNQSRGISAFMIYNMFKATIYDSNHRISSLVNANDGFRIWNAVIGENSSECYVYQRRCQTFTDYEGIQIQNQTIRIQKYLNSTLAGYTTLNSDDCVKYSLNQIIYSKNMLFLHFTQRVLVFNVSSWEQLFIYIYQHTSFYRQNFMDMSVSSTHLIFGYEKTVYVVSLPNWNLMCVYNQTQVINSVKIVQGYTFYTTLTKIVQFDYDICKIIDQSPLPTTNVQYDIQYSYLTKQLILNRQQCRDEWFGRYYKPKTFLYSYSFDYGYLSNNRSCLPTYGYLAGRCIKGYGRSQPPPLPPPSKQTIPIKNVSIVVQSTSPTSTLQKMIIPTATLLVSVLVSYLAYLLISHCIEFYKVKGKGQGNQKWWETINEQKNKNHQL